MTDYASSHNEIFPGQDYSNPRIKDFHKGKKWMILITYTTCQINLLLHIVSQYDMELIDKRSAPRMPWHDIHTAMVIIYICYQIMRVNN